MNLKIRMYSDDYNYEYEVPVCYFKGLFTFKIKELNNNISVYEENDKVYLSRTGTLKQTMCFDLDKTTTSTIEDENGLCIDVNIKTNKLIFNEKGFFIDYNLYNDVEFVSNHKIYAKILK